MKRQTSGPQTSDLGIDMFRSICGLWFDVRGLGSVVPHV
jgi:hypothetical protein